MRIPHYGRKIQTKIVFNTITGLRAVLIHDIMKQNTCLKLYVPHPVVGAINQNPEQGVVLLDEKK